MAKRDYYEILGVDKSADTPAIKKAYRSLAMKYHPDRNPSDAQAAEAMKEINEAYAVLSDGYKRRLYDTYGHAGLEGYTQEDIFRGVDFSSLFHEFGLRDLFGFGGGIFNDFFSGRAASRREPRRGADLRYDLSVTLEEVAFGMEKTVKLPRAETCTSCRGTGAADGGLSDCDACHGTGQIVREQRSGYSVFRQITGCSACRGSGKIVKEACKDCEGRGVIETIEEIQITIPAGAYSGYSIRLDGKGEKDGGMVGDLYIVLQVEEHPIFERHDDDIYVQQDISMTVAALGGEIQVPSLNGDLALDIPDGTQTGAVFRISEKGIAHLNGVGRGDEYVIVKVVTPVDLSVKERELLRQFEKLRKQKEERSDQP